VSLRAFSLISDRQRSVRGACQLFEIIIVFLISFLLIAILTDRHIEVYDEGLILTGAMRVAAGAVPHRDFYALYGPGQYYVLAALFDGFGQSVLVERLYDVAVKAAIVCVVYAMSFRLMRGLFAILVASTCLLWLGGLGFPVYPIWPSLFFTLLSALPLFAIFDGRYSALRLISSGLCAGAVFLFRYDMGIAAVAMVSLALVLWSLVKSRGRPAGAVTGTAALLLPFWCGAALIILPLVAAYIKYGVLNDFVFQVLFVSAHYYEMRALSWPSILRGNSIVYFPPLTIISCIAILVSEYGSGDIYNGSKANNWIGILLATFAVGLYLKGVVRISPIHMAPSIITSFIVFGFAVDRFLTDRHLPARPALAVLLLAPLLCATRSSGALAVRGSPSIARDNLVEATRLARLSMARAEPSAPTGGRFYPTAELDRARGFITSDGDRQAVRFVVSNSAPGETIFVADGENDKILMNNEAVYFLAGRQPASKWDQFDPGLQTTEAIQDQIIHDLEENKPPLIVIDTEWDNVEEPNQSSRHSGVKNLDHYFQTHYKEVSEIGFYKFLHRR
jgi:hypothetical protein